jgi:Ca2+-binding RTX toxin-like protein
VRFVAAVVLGVLVSAAPAAAGTVELRDTGPIAHTPGDVYEVVFEAAPGESNIVSVSAGPGGVFVRDTGTPVTPGAFCTQGIDGVSCSPAVGGFVTGPAVVDLGDGDDRLAVEGISATVRDGPGDDVIEIPSGVFEAGAGADVMRITNPAAASEVTYATRTAGVSITEDGQANDGEPGERDDVGFGIQHVQGGFGDDVLVGGQEPHILDGNAGDDRLIGGPRDDILTGDDSLTGSGNDFLSGGDGDDRLLGGPGADVIRGGPGEDSTAWPNAPSGVQVTLDDRPGDGMPGEGDDVGSDVEILHGTTHDDTMVGSDGPQVLDGDKGDDRLDGAGGPDQIFGGTGEHNILTGGPGVDRLASAGPRDTIITRDGERDAVTCGTPSSSRQRFDIDAVDSVRSCSNRLRIRGGQRPRLDRRGRIALAAYCPARRGTCAGTVLLSRCRVTPVPIGHADFRLAEGTTRRARVHLAPGARRAVARHGSLCAVTTARTHRTRPPPSAVQSTARITIRR